MIWNAISEMPSYDEADKNEDALIKRASILEKNYDAADSMWREARNHPVGCECKKCVLEFARAVWNHLQNRKAWNGRSGGKWGVGEDTATGLCYRLYGTGRKDFQPIGDFHGMSVHASTVRAELAIPTAIHDIESCFMRQHETTRVGKGSISPRECFMIQAEKYWNKNPFTNSWDDMKSSVAIALMLLMVAWARGLAGEGMTYAALAIIASKRGANIRWATEVEEHMDIDAVLTTKNGDEKMISIKTGRTLGYKTLHYYRSTMHKTKPNFYAGGTGIITPENVVVYNANRFE